MSTTARTETRNFSLPLCADVFFAYGAAGESCPSANARGAVGVPFFTSFFPAWKAPCVAPNRALEGLDYAFAPNGTWATGRNALYAAIHAHEKRRGCQFLYHMYGDDDAALRLVGHYGGHRRYFIDPRGNAHGPAQFNMLAQWLFTVLPPVGYPHDPKLFAVGNVRADPDEG